MLDRKPGSRSRVEGHLRRRRLAIGRNHPPFGQVREATHRREQHVLCRRETTPATTRRRTRAGSRCDSPPVDETRNVWPIVEAILSGLEPPGSGRIREPATVGGKPWTMRAAPHEQLGLAPAVGRDLTQTPLPRGAPSGTRCGRHRRRRSARGWSARSSVRRTGSPPLRRCIQMSRCPSPLRSDEAGHPLTIRRDRRFRGEV